MNLAKTPIALCRRQDQVRRDDGAVEPLTQPGKRPFRQRTPRHPTRSGPAHPSRKPAARPAPRPSADGRRGVRRFSADAVGPWRPAKWTGDDRVSPGSRPKPQPPAHAPRRLPDRAEPGHPAAGSDRVPCRRSQRAGGCARTPSPPGGVRDGRQPWALLSSGALLCHIITSVAACRRSSSASCSSKAMRLLHSLWQGGLSESGPVCVVPADGPAGVFQPAGPDGVQRSGGSRRRGQWLGRWEGPDAPAAQVLWSGG